MDRGRGTSEKRFNDLAIRMYLRQRLMNPVYRRFCEVSGARESILSWKDIPALPVSAFKAAPIFCYPTSKARRVFRTSGTTHGQKRGEHHFRTLEHYDTAIDALFGSCVMAGLRRARFASLVSPASEKPDSSLSYMAARVMRVFASERFEAARGGSPRFVALAQKLGAWSRQKTPVVIFSTTLALDAFLSYLAENKICIALPRQSRIMETGGSKGKTVFTSRAQCLRLAAKYLGIGARNVINEYGMTELTSQFYDLPGTSIKTGASWTRVLLIDPVTGRPAKRGFIRIFDLANQDSCLAIQTEDLAREVRGGFELLGRKPGADLRGCSLSFEELGALG